MNILFTLCGRAGSKGVKGKNARDFCGKPLVWYSMAAIALYKERYAGNDTISVVLNTDSEPLIDLVQQVSSLEVGILHRDESLAGDKVAKVSVILDCLNRAEQMYGLKYDMVVDLDITSPLRTAEDVRNAILRKAQRPEVDVVYSVTHARRNPYFNMVKEENGFFCKAIPSSFTTRQEAPTFYDMNASIYAYSPSALREKEHATFFNSNCDAIVMFDSGILDIDSEEDYELMQVIALYLWTNKEGYKEVYSKVKKNGNMSNNLDKYTITENATIREALRKINDISSEAQMLFVVDVNKRVIATLSDGDIRRGLIAGHELFESVESIMFKDFQFIDENELNVCHLPELRKKGIQIVPILSIEGYLLKILNLNKQRSMLPIDAVIMAGGKGERLRPLTEKTPKPLLTVGDKAIIDHNVDRLIQYGVEHISVTTNYLAEQIESHYAQPRNEVQIQCVREPKFLGTMGAVRLVKEFHNDVVLVMNSDLFTDIDFEDMYLHFMENKADMSIAAVPYTVSIPFGICDLDGRDVKGIVEKPTYNYYANAGIYMLRREVINLIPKDEFFNATDLIDALVKNGSKVIRYPLKGTWIDIGTMSEYQKAKDLVRHIR